MSPGTYITKEKTKSEYQPNFWCDLFCCKTIDVETSKNSGYYQCSRCKDISGYFYFKFKA